MHILPFRLASDFTSLCSFSGWAIWLFGFTADCVGQCENMLSVHLSNLDWQPGPLGKLDDASQRSLIRAIGHVIEADCEPN